MEGIVIREGFGRSADRLAGLEVVLNGFAVGRRFAIVQVRKAADTDHELAGVLAVDEGYRSDAYGGIMAELPLFTNDPCRTSTEFDSV